MSTWDAVVVGAGVNGLTAAARLARAGRRVLVIERADEVGGNARTADMLVPGVRHDLAAAIVPFAAASPAFAALGLPIRFEHAPVVLAHPFDDGTAATVWRDLDATAVGLGVDGERYRRVLGPFVRRFEALAVDVLASQLKVPRHPLLLARFGPFAIAPATMLARAMKTASAKALLSGLGAHANVPPDAALTGGVGLTLLIAAHAVGWPVVKGGTSGVPLALAQLVRDAGGEIELGREVRSLAELPSASSTFFDVTPRQLVAIAPEIAPRPYRRWRYGPGACKVDYVLSGPMPWTAPACHDSATVHVGGTAAEVLVSEREIAAGRMPDRPFLLVAQPHVADPTRVVDGLRPLWTYCHAPNGSAVDASPAIERQLDRFAPDWRDLVVAKRVLTARDSEATNPNLVGGDIAGGLMTVRQLMLGPRAGRSPYRTERPDVFLCSSSCPPGAGIHGMAGWHAAGIALSS